MAKVCDMDCFNCKFDDCIKDDVYSDKDRYCNRSEKQKQYQREYQKKKRDEARAKGLCIICRKLPATNGSKCLDCYLRQKRHDREKYDGKRDRWIEDGKCYFCGSEVVKGKKVCEKHYGIYRHRAEEMNKLPQTKAAQIKFAAWHWRQRKGEHNEKQM